MTVQMLLENVSIAELLSWEAFYRIENEEQQHRNEQQKLLRELKKNRL